jgi:6-phosphogluconolactonase (cycloisomerase 2 family)
MDFIFTRRTRTSRYFILAVVFLLQCSHANYESQCNPKSKFFKTMIQLKYIAPDFPSFCGIFAIKSNTSASTSTSAISPPTNISYSQSLYTFTQGTTINAITPSIIGNITSCAANPTLPAGLILDNTTCSISGNPTVGSPVTEYKITASNSAGGISNSIRIRTLFGSAKFAYVPNFSSNNISVFSIDANTGVLSSVSTTGLGTSGRDVVVDFSGKYLYALAYGTSMVHAFAINNATGALSAIGSPLPTGTNPNSVTLHPTGKFLYVTSTGGTVNSYNVDQTTGLLTASGSVATGSTSRWVRVDPSGKYAFTVNSGTNDMYTYSIDQTTGVLSQVGSPLIVGTDPRSLSITPDGKYIYIAEFNVNHLTPYAFDQSTGGITTGSFVSVTSAPESVFVHPTGKYVYVAYTAGGPLGSISGYNINATTGAITIINTATNTTVSPNRLVIDPTGKFAYSSNYTASTVTLFTIDPITGVVTTGASYTPGTNPNGIFITGVNP